jgi:hypothetical protein
MRGSAAFRASVTPSGALAGPWVRNPLWTAARAVPSLDLRFADNKSLVDATTGANLVDFTRASSGTYVDSEGVIRTAVTNLLLRSEEFETTWGTFGLSVTANQETAPNGALTADLISINGSGQGIWQPVTSAPGVQYTFSVYVKLGTMSAANYKIAVRDDTAGVFIASDVEPTQAPSSNGWTRISYTATAPAGCTTIRFYAFRNTANVTGTIYLWGAQLEKSTTVGEYIPTTSTINSAPRFDHDPTTGESLGLLVEEQRTNLLLRSEEFDNASWAKGDVTVQENAALAPNGSTLADKLIASATTTVHNISQAVTASSAAHTFSIYLKAAELTTVSIRAGRSGNFVNADINLSLGTIASPTTSGTATNVSSSIQSVSNDWYRCSVTGSNLGDGQIAPVIYIPDDASLPGDGTSGIYLWGAQLEAGAFPTSYIPTSGTAATRAADVASISGSNFSSWYRQDEGTVFYDGQVLGTESGNKNLLGLSTGSGNNTIDLFIPSGLSQRFRMVTASVQQVLQNAIPTADVYSPAKVAYAFKLDDTNSAGNGTVQSTDTSCTIPTVDRFTFGLLATGEAQAAARFKRLTYWPARLPNETLQTITQ